MKVLEKIWNYIRFKKDKNAEGNSYLKAMHGINKISILLFLMAIIVMVYRCQSE